MTAQLDMFDLLPAEGVWVGRLRLAIGAESLANLAWWCTYGCSSMCAATIRRAIGCTPSEAHQAVLQLKGAA